MKSIYIDGFQIHTNNTDIGYLVRQPLVGFDVPPVRLSSYDKIGEWGSFLSNQLYSARLITLQGDVYAYDVVTFEQRRRALLNLLQVTKDGNSVPTSHTLQFTTLDNLTLTANVYLQGLQFDRTNLLSASFNMTLFCPDFAFYNVNSTSVTLNVLSPGGGVIPIIFPMVLSASSGNTTIAVNNGNTPTFPLITLTGPLTNPTIQSNTLNRYMTFSTTLASGQQLVVDMKNKLITQGTSPKYSLLSSGYNWWWLNPGNNTLELITTNNSDTGNVLLTYNDAYIGA